MSKRNLYRVSGVKFYLNSSDGRRPRPYLKKRKVVAQAKLISKNNWMSGVGLEAVYRPGVSNSATFFDLDTLIRALDVWTEASLVEYCVIGNW